MTETMRGGKCQVCHRKPSKPGAWEGLVLPPGTLLSRGRFVVGALLGRGGFGITYTGLYNDPKTSVETPIAIKEFFPKHLVTCRQGTALAYPPEKREEFERFVRSFIKEADIINHLKRHPGIVNVKYRFNDNNTAYIGMELLQGTDLRKHVNNLPQPLSAREAFQMLLPVMDAIQFIHENDVLHRDISPDNIFLCQGEGGETAPKLIDFGAAHIAVSEFTQSFPNVKKSGFSPLEQNWVTDSQGPWMDVYAFASTFYFSITGKVPAAAPDRSGQVDKLLPPSKLGADIPRAAEAVLLKGMAVRADDRYQSMGDFRDAMREALKPGDTKKDKADHSRQSRAESVVSSAAEPARPIKPNPIKPNPIKANSRWARALAYGGNLLVFCGLAGLLLGAPGFLLGLPLMVMVNAALEFMTPHASLCMRLTRWRVQKADGGAPTLPQCFARNLLLAMAPFAVLEWLWMLYSGEGQALHDTLTGTRLCSGVEITNETKTSESAPFTNEEPKTRKTVLACVEGVMIGKQWHLEERARIGRGKEQNDVIVPPEDGLVSKAHCVVFLHNGRYCLRDCGSRNGTYFNGEKLSQGDDPVPLKHGDTFRAGREIFEIKLQ